MSEMENHQLPSSWAKTTLDAIRLDLAVSENPARDPETMFELYSVPSHEHGTPEIIPGKRIGSSKKSVEPNTVLLCKINPRINRVWVTGNHSEHRKLVSTEWIPFFPLSDIDPRYLAYFLRQNHIRNILAANASGVGGSLMRVSAVTLQDLEFRLAPKAEQTRIADALDELFTNLDAGVSALVRVQDRLKRYRDSVLKMAVEGVLTVDWRAAHRNAELASGLLKRILTDRHRRWENDQLCKFAEKGKVPPKNWRTKYKESPAPDTTDMPRLPESWCWTSVGRCFVVRVGATPSRSVAEYWNGDIPWVASGEVQFWPISATREKITNAGLANTSTQINPKGSVILNMIGEGKTRGKASILEIDACNNQNCAAIWVSQTPILPKYIYYWLVYRYEETRKLGSGNNQPAMNKSIVEGIVFPLPPMAEQEVIVEVVDDKLSVVNYLEADLNAKLKTAQGLKQAILRRAFTGRLVPQDPNDEPGSELLNRIANEREARVREAAAAKRAARITSLRRSGRRGQPQKRMADGTS